ncbi:MAG: hypothetical protein Kapaf2KO_06570 [Candidatus Kapaibacteriales bacterium]
MRFITTLLFVFLVQIAFSEDFQWRATNLHAPQMEAVEHILANDSAVYVFFKDWHGNRELHRYKDGKFKKIWLDSTMSHYRTYVSGYHISNNYLYNLANNDVFKITENGFEQYSNYRIFNAMGPYVLRGNSITQYISKDGGDSFDKLPDSNLYWAVNYNRLYYSRNGFVYSSLHDGRDEVKYKDKTYIDLDPEYRNIFATYNEIYLFGVNEAIHIYNNRSVDTIRDYYWFRILDYINGNYLLSNFNSINNNSGEVHRIRIAGMNTRWNDRSQRNLVFYKGEYYYYESGKGLVSTVDFKSFKYHGFADIGNSLHEITTVGKSLYLNDFWMNTGTETLGYNTEYDGKDFELVDIRYEDDGQVVEIFNPPFKVCMEDDENLFVVYTLPWGVDHRVIGKFNKSGNNSSYTAHIQNDYSHDDNHLPYYNDGLIISKHSVMYRNGIRDSRWRMSQLTMVDLETDTLTAYVSKGGYKSSANLVALNKKGIYFHLPHRFDGMVYYNSNNFVVLDSTFESLGYVRTLDTLGNLIPEPFFSDMNESGDTLTAHDTLGNVYFMLAGTDTTFRQVAHSERRRYWSGDRLQYQDNLLSFDHGDNFYHILNGLNIRDAEYFKGELYAILEDGAFYRLEKEAIGSSRGAELNSLVFPNPSSSIFNVKRAISGKLLSSDGSQIMGINNENTIDLSDSPNGVYFLHTSDGDMIKLVKGE